MRDGVLDHGYRSKLQSIDANNCPYRRLRAWLATTFGDLLKAANNGKIHCTNATILVGEVHSLGVGGVTNEVVGHGCRSKHRSTVANTLGARLKPNVVPAKLFQCSRLSSRNRKSSKFICPPTKPTRTWWQNMLFASLGGPRWYAYICCPARCHVKKTCFQKQFLLEHHWNTAGTSYWNFAGTSTLQQEQSTRKGKMVTYIVV